MNSVDIILRVCFGGVICILSIKVIHSIIAYFSGRSRYKQGHRAAAMLAEAVEGERRRHSRVDISLPVRMVTSQGTIEAETKNITLVGAFICCQNPLPLGERFRLTITPPDSRSLAVNVEVLWSNTNVPADKIVHRGMGIRFVHITEDEREILNDMVSAHLESSVE